LAILSNSNIWLLVFLLLWLLVVINGYCYLLYTCLLIPISGYYINGYWWLFYLWPLVVILLVAIILMAIDGYYIDGY
jgi:hypothetical protein